MKKPVIGISGSEMRDSSGSFAGYRRSYVNQDYVDAVIKNGGVPYIIPFNEDEEVIKAQMSHVQGLILSGGHDVDPHLYREEPLPKLGQTWPARDKFDLLLLKLAEEAGMPILGICRGFQLINVAHGGSLYQDISYRTGTTLKHDQVSTPSLPTHGMHAESGSHLAKVLGETDFLVNSFHHLLAKDIAPDLIASAKASDGVVEGLENAAGNLLAVQWHPEMLHNNPAVAYQNNLFKFVVDNAK